MSLEDYKSALRLGQKEYRAAIARGEYPYLQVLDEVTSYTDLVGEESLGLVDIPMDHLAGTKTAGRRWAFARNFMPLLEPESEFAVKWTALCQAHLVEGIRDPIQAFEFLNRFYVAEGNKRVSVLKYFGAPSVPGVVRRVIPQRRDTLESHIYYDFLAFYRLTRVNCLWFSRPGRFQELLEVVGGADEPWSDERRVAFLSVYRRFRALFHSLGGGGLDMTTGDAFLTYLKLYDYRSISQKTDAQLREELQRGWKELAVHSQPQPVALTLSPAPEQRSLLEKLLPSHPASVKVSFLHQKTPETSGWTLGHERGREYLQRTLAGRVDTSSVENVTQDNASERIAQAVAEGAQVIFTTSPTLLEPTLKAAVDYPEVKFLNCSLNTPHPSLRTYYGRMYEAKFLSGALAGVLTQRHAIGYVADYPIYGAPAAINAFALGARMVDPYAKVYLEWSCRRDFDLYHSFRGVGVDLISYQDLLSPKDSKREYGLYQVGEGRGVRLAITRWNWGKFYALILRSVLDGAWRAEVEREGPKAINYWWGLSAGVVELLFSQNLPSGVRRLLHFLEDSILSGSFCPFEGPLLAQDRVILEKGELSPQDIVRMDWLAENVSGAFPTLEELTEEARPLVAVQGLGRGC